MGCWLQAKRTRNKSRLSAAEWLINRLGRGRPEGRSHRKTSRKRKPLNGSGKSNACEWAVRAKKLGKISGTRSGTCRSDLAQSLTTEGAENTELEDHMRMAQINAKG